jgi:hypothetical protein
MVVQVIVYAVSFVVVFLRLSNRCAAVFCVVPHFDKVVVMLASAFVCCLFYVGASFVNLGVAWDSIVFLLLLLLLLLLSFYKFYVGNASVDFISVC